MVAEVLLAGASLQMLIPTMSDKLPDRGAKLQDQKQAMLGHMATCIKDRQTS